MNTSAKRILLSCGTLAVAACLCLSMVGVAWAGLLLWETGLAQHSPSSQHPALPATPPVQSTQTAEPLRPDTSPDTSMDQIEGQVQALRGLSLQRPVERQRLSTAALRQYVVNNFLQDYTPEEAHDDVLTLSAFGLLPPDFDMLSMYTELLTEQVAGFYDDETKAMYVVQNEDFGGPQRMTYAHEFTHALQDQHYNLRGNLHINAEYCQEHSEYCAAVQSLVEGDATLVQQLWLTDYATSQDYSEIYEFYGTLQSPVFDSAPEYLQQDFLFPYQQGKDFVRSLYEQGGWDAVNRAYEVLPQSSEQILHPERYPADAPLRVELPELSAALPVGWRQVDSGTLGEWYTYLVLAYGQSSPARLPEAQAAAAAEGWGGDAYRVYVSPDEQQFVLLLDTVWDTRQDATEFRRTLQRYLSRRLDATTQNAGESLWEWETNAGYARLLQVDNRTLWLLAPEKTIAGDIWQVVAP